jgi:hypothetical protein
MAFDEEEEEFDEEFGPPTNDEMEAVMGMLGGAAAAMGRMDQTMYEILLGSMPAGERKNFERLVGDLSQVPEAELAGGLKHPPKGIPPLMVSMMAAIARQMRAGNIRPTTQSKPLPPLPPPAMSKPKPPPVPLPPPAAKPNQFSIPLSPPPPKPKPVRPEPLDDPNQLDLF